MLLKKSSCGLHLFIDSTDLKFLGKGKWKLKKHKPKHRWQYCKLLSGIDADPVQISAVQFTINNISDSLVLVDLDNQIPPVELIDSVYTDGSYDTKKCREVISDWQAHAVIPPRKMLTLERYKD